MLYFYKEEQGKIIDALFFPNATMADYERLKDAKDGIVFLSDSQKDYIPTEQPIIQLADGSYSFSSVEEAEGLQKNKELELLKKSKLSNAHTLFVKKRDAVVWVDLPDGRYGFDTAPEDIVNFMSAVKSAELDGSSIYKVWDTETTKTMREFSIADFNKVFVEARKNQLQAYAWFEKVRAEINACNTKEELDKIGEKYGTKIN